MRATHDAAALNRSSSKSRRRSNKSRRKQARASIPTQIQARGEHSEIRPVSVLTNPPPVAETTDAACTLATTEEEQSFFAQACEFPVSELEFDDPKPLFLRPEQLQRRLWLRRQVARLMAGLGTFSVIATAIQLTSNV